VQIDTEKKEKPVEVEEVAVVVEEESKQ